MRSFAVSKFLLCLKRNIMHNRFEFIWRFWSALPEIFPVPQLSFSPFLKSLVFRRLWCVRWKENFIILCTTRQRIRRMMEMWDWSQICCVREMYKESASHFCEKTLTGWCIMDIDTRSKHNTWLIWFSSSKKKQFLFAETNVKRHYESLLCIKS